MKTFRFFLLTVVFLLWACEKPEFDQFLTRLQDQGFSTKVVEMIVGETIPDEKKISFSLDGVDTANIFKLTGYQNFPVLKLPLDDGNPDSNLVIFKDLCGREMYLVKTDNGQRNGKITHTVKVKTQFVMYIEEIHKRLAFGTDVVASYPSDAWKKIEFDDFVFIVFMRKREKA